MVHKVFVEDADEFRINTGEQNITNSATDLKYDGDDRISVVTLATVKVVSAKAREQEASDASLDSTKTKESQSSDDSIDAAKVNDKQSYNASVDTADIKKIQSEKFYDAKYDRKLTVNGPLLT